MAEPKTGSKGSYRGKKSSSRSRKYSYRRSGRRRKIRRKLFSKWELSEWSIILSVVLLFFAFLVRDMDIPQIKLFLGLAAFIVVVMFILGFFQKRMKS